MTRYTSTGRALFRHQIHSSSGVHLVSQRIQWATGNPSPGAKGPECETDPSNLRAKIRNAWNCTVIFLIHFHEMMPKQRLTFNFVDNFY